MNHQPFIRLFFVVLLFFIPFGFSQINKTSDIKSALKNQFIQFVREEVTLQQLKVLEQSGFSSTDIHDIVLSPSFRAFVREIVKSPHVNQVIDKRIDEILTPGFIESQIRKQLNEANSQQRDDIILALRTLERFRNRPAQMLNDDASSTFLSRLWQTIKKELFG
ncbi:MAG: hypothetical protein KDD48_07925 [Bdellovibrionales bacterium]|nr:hypothetical protein [Bdellovibrionales bacterium]